MYEIQESRPHRYASLPPHPESIEPKPNQSRSSLFHISRSLKALIPRYLFLATVWGFFSQQTLVLTTQSTCAVCPANAGWGRMIPLAQLVKLGLDALIITQVARIRRRHADSGQQLSSVWAFLGVLCLFSAWALATLLYFSNLCFPQLESFKWVPSFHRLLANDLIFDSIIAAAVLLSAVSLLSTHSPPGDSGPNCGRNKLIRSPLQKCHRRANGYTRFALGKMDPLHRNHLRWLVAVRTPSSCLEIH